MKPVKFEQVEVNDGATVYVEVSMVAHIPEDEIQYMRKIHSWSRAEAIKNIALGLSYRKPHEKGFQGLGEYDRKIVHVVPEKKLQEKLKR